MKKRLIITILALIVVFGGIFGWDLLRGYFIQQFFAKFEPPPVTISASPTKVSSWHPRLVTVGNFVANKGVDLNAEVGGVVKAIYFKSGQVIEANTPLLKLDDNVEQAQLQDNNAQYTLAKLNYERFKNLVEKKAAPRSELDAARAKLAQAEAQINKTKALIAQKNIQAPFEGKLGIRLVNLGEYISPGTTKLVTLQDLDPLLLRFYLPEQNIQLLHLNQTVNLSVTAHPGKIFKGKITAINPKVDPRTHNVLVQATIPNKAELLFPGMFAEIDVVLPTQKDVITVPHTAISYSLYGNSVYVVKEKGKDKDGKPILRAYRQFVKTGDVRGNEIAILDGIKAGDMVVNSGQLKLENGARVVINNTVLLNGPVPNV